MHTVYKKCFSRPNAIHIVLQRQKRVENAGTVQRRRPLALSFFIAIQHKNFRSRNAKRAVILTKNQDRGSLSFNIDYISTAMNCELSTTQTSATGYVAA